ARGHWGCELWCRRARGGAARPHPMEHVAQPHKSDQHQLVEKETRDHGKSPSYRWRNEDILPGLQTVGISRTLEVHGPILPACSNTLCRWMKVPYPRCRILRWAWISIPGWLTDSTGSPRASLSSSHGVRSRSSSGKGTNVWTISEWSFSK